MTVAIYAYAFYLGFALSVSVYRQWLKGVLNIWNKIAFSPVLLVFFIVDLGLNWTVFMAFGWPPAGTYTISDRMAFYRKVKGTEFQKAFANFMCDGLLNPIDPTGSHC